MYMQMLGFTLAQAQAPIPARGWLQENIEAFPLSCQILFLLTFCQSINHIPNPTCPWADSPSQLPHPHSLIDRLPSLPHSLHVPSISQELQSRQDRSKECSAAIEVAFRPWSRAHSSALSKAHRIQAIPTPFLQAINWRSQVWFS